MECDKSEPFSLGIDKSTCTPCSIVQTYLSNSFWYPNIIFAETCVATDGTVITDNEKEDIDATEYENPVKDDTVVVVLSCDQLEAGMDGFDDC